MNVSLTTAQSLLLRRCSGGLRIWESGADRQSLLVQLNALQQLGLVAFDESAGYETTAGGEAWLLEFDE